MKKVVLALAAPFTVAASVLSPSPAWPDATIITAGPAMTGTAEEPKVITTGDRFDYIIKQTDKDTFSDPALSPGVTVFQDVDIKCAMEAIATRSMTSFGFSQRGVDATTATWTYDVQGIAIPVTVETTKVDDWRLKNTHPQGNAGNDTVIVVKQRVTIKPLPSKPVDDPLPPGGN